jgi:cytochrome b involved in lipid metabolism
MGWLKLARRPKTHQNLSDVNTDTSNKAVFEHVDSVTGNAARHSQTPEVCTSPLNSTKRLYPCVPESTPNEDLPFIPAAEVLARRRTEDANSPLPASKALRDELKSSSGHELWIVVDDVIYDCTEFIEEHPGGEQVISSFIGEDCSWQFWRFHGKSEMDQYGHPLRVGRTTGIKNRFPEPVRYVGLSRLGDDDW